MTETSAIRKPVQVLQLDFPKCANQYGCAPCKAGLGTIAESDLTVDFGKVGLNSEFSLSSNCTVTRTQGGINVVSTASDPTVSTPGVSNGYDGDTYRYIVVHGRLNTVSGNDEWSVFYRNSGIGYGEARRIRALNRSVPFRGPALNTLVDGDEFVAVFDASSSTDYATQYQGKTINGLRMDLQSGNGANFDVYSITVCTENLFAAAGSECFNTRATCQNIDNYRARPWTPIIPDETYANGDTITATDIDRAVNTIIACDVGLTDTPAGTILMLGSASNGLYIGITGSDLVACCGGVVSTDQARATVATSTVLGKSLTLIAEIDYDGDAITLWAFDKTQRTLTQLATDTASTALPAAWAAATNGVVGDDGAAPVSTEDGGTWNGVITSVRIYENQLFNHRPVDAFKLSLYFGYKEQNRPLDDDKIILPMLQNVSTVGSRINIAAADRDYDPLGGRATVNIEMEDSFASDRTVDPYFTGRLYDTTDTTRGTFWERERVRQKYGKVGALVQIYDGYADQALAGMRKRAYLLDEIDLPRRQNISMRCRDVLSRAELSKARAPDASPGALSADLTNVATSMTTTGHTLDDYPQAGTVRINNECMTYSAIVDNLNDTYTWTITLRASDGTTAAEHETGDTVQLCRRYTLQRIDTIMQELLGSDAGIEFQYLDIAGWKSEVDDFLIAYTLTTLITEATAVSQLLGEISEQCSLYMWWDERDQVIRMKAIRALSVEPPRYTDDANFIADSVAFVEKPEERVSQVWVYYLQTDPTQRLDDIQNYKNLYADVNLGAESDEEYGQRSIRTIFSRWLPTEALATQTASRLATRYVDIPLEARFELDAKDRALWVGDVIYINNYRLRKASGALDTSRVFLVTSAREIVPGEVMLYTAEDATLAGFIAVILANGTPDYVGDGTDQFNGAWISDANGLYSNGDIGARIT